MAENRRPLSLNERHNRLLQDFTASQSRPSHRASSNPPLDENKSAKVKLVGRRRLCKASLTEDDNDDDVLRFAGIADFDSSPEEVKQSKGKFDVQHGVCKASSNYNRHKNDVEIVDDTGKLQTSETSHFDSPPSVENANEPDVGSGCNEIRDILNELSSKLEFLTIQKKQSPKLVDSVGDAKGLVLDEHVDQQENINFTNDDTVPSSLSILSDQADSLSDTVGQHRFVTQIETTANKHGQEADLESEFDDSSLVGRVNRIENTDKTVGKIAQSTISNVGRQKVEDDDPGAIDDDCIILSNRKLIKESKTSSKLKEEFNDLVGSNEVDDHADFIMKDENAISLGDPGYSFTLPSKVANMLYPHQRDGLKWLWSLHCQGKGGILGDDMGLGKTMQICGFLAGLFHSSLIKRAMVVAPKTLLSHWIKELSAVGLSEKIREYYSTCPKARQYELQNVLQDKGILLTTYDIVRNNVKSLCGDFFCHDDRSADDTTWDYMILDEGHLIKNPNTQRAQSLLEIPSAHRIIISGTPIQNNLKELWALFNFCCPELLGDKRSFKERYEHYILRGNDKNASDRDKRIGSKVAMELREHIQPYFLRRLKTEVFSKDNATTAKLSTKNEVIVWLRLTNCQRKIYEAFLNSELVLSAFDGSPLAALTILKKICDHPYLLTKRAAEDVLEGMDSMLSPEDRSLAENLALHLADVSERGAFHEKHDNISCKISFILSLLGNLIPEGHYVLIFSQTRKMLNLIEESLVSEGYSYLRIDGTTKASDRVKIVNDFQEGHVAPIFLLTSQVGGLGLTLTKADRVIVVDPAWNPSTDNQSVDRAYRIGQKKDVIVYRLMTCGTIEEKIYKMQIFKGGLFKIATEHKEQTRYFSQQDLRELFSLPKMGFDMSLTQQQLHEEHDSQHKMDESLKTHVKFLESLGIAGVSHHSLLFTKTSPVQVVQEEEEVTRSRGATFLWNSSSRSFIEQNVDGAEYAFNPKDVKLHGKQTSSLGSVDKEPETEIKQRINRLSQIFANKATVSKLPDKGERILKQIAALQLELENIIMAKRTDKEVVDVDEITEGFHRVLNV